jgi:hypothetical protein
MMILLVMLFVGMGTLRLLAAFGEPSRYEEITIVALVNYWTLLLLGLGFYGDQFHSRQTPVTPVKSDYAGAIIIRIVAAVLSSAAIALIQPLGSFVLKRIMPAKVSMPELVFRRLEATYERAYLMCNAVYAIVVVGSTALWFWGLQICTSYRLRSLGNLVFERGPDKLALLMASLFSGLVLAIFLISGAFHLWPGKWYEEFNLYCNARFEKEYSYDAKAMSILMMLWFSVLGMGMSAIQVDRYVRISERGIVINPTWSFGEQRYRFDEVKAILQVSHYKARIGRVVESPRLVLEFSDGFVWSTQDHPGHWEGVRAEEQALARFVSRRSEIPIRQVRLYPPAGMTTPFL